MKQIIPIEENEFKMTFQGH